jgi:hypothetical protein
MRWFLVIVFYLLSGCSAYQAWYGETKPGLTVYKLSDKSGIFTWSPKNTSAVVQADGDICVQGADIFHAQSGSIEVGNQLAAILKGLETTDLSSEDKALVAKISNDFSDLKTSTERNTFLSIGFFGICQLHANGALSDQDVLQLAKELIDRAALLPTEVTSNQTKRPGDAL